MDTSSDSDEELFPIVTDELYLNTARNVFLYDDPLLYLGVLRAVVEENLEKVKQLIESGKSVNINDNNGNTPLHIAVIKNNLEILEYLLSRDDLVVNVRNFKGETPLYYAVRMGRLQSATKLIQAGANVNLPNYEDVTPLHVSVSYPEVAHLLILYGAKIDAVDYSSDTPLHDATAERALNTVCMLLYYNADANSLGGNSLTPFMKALISEDIEVQEALFEYVDDFNVATEDHMTTLAIALTHETVFVEEIIKRGADVNYADSYENEDVACPFLLCLRVPNSENFKLIWEKLHYNEIRNTINLCLFFEHLDREDVENYIQVIIKTGNLKPAVESLTKNDNYFLFINKFAENKLKLEQLTVFTCCLLQYGYRTTSYDIYAIFFHYGYCELLKILLFMDNDYRKGWLPCMIVPRLMFDLDCQLMNKVNEIYEIHKKDVLQLLEYFICPPFISALIFKYREEEQMKKLLESMPKVPSLMELARNATQTHILKSFDIVSTCQLYTIIKHLNVSSVYKKILLFEKKLYRFKRCYC
ncbi:ankyrin repeat and SOCS box protein 14-like [Anoplophora glabripennis]|uniref:ankyrin repeat and SOCS box protein 14-like n=1 Tax=Anoplophora glabripennis TaxID=217634 RepID=UPI0008749B26|nr:ankyrin repeat and SOCS box protein 14-like [Anoplophora glabripennis]